MDIGGLPDDLLVKILTFILTKVAVSTCILSKRWKFLWMWLPKLEFISPWNENSGLGEFINRKLPLHRAPVIESLRLDLCRWDLKPKDIKRSINIAVSRHLRELEISCDNENIFPSSFFTCKSLATLILGRVFPIDIPSMACLPSLKTLQLKYVTFVDRKSLQQLLSICPVLEDLSVHFYEAENNKEFSISVLSLQSLSLFTPNLSGYVINTPSLKYLKLEDWSKVRHDSLIKNMPKLREAYVDIRHINPPSVIGSITSAKRLTICCSSEDLYCDGFVFNQLEHLKLCVRKRDSLNFLGQLLQNSPNLRVLDISIERHYGRVCWNQPSSVPECLLSNLHIFKWSPYFGTLQDRDIAVYILQNACHLKMATFLADTTKSFIPNLKDLSLTRRASSTCQLVFTEDLDDIET